MKLRRTSPSDWRKIHHNKHISFIDDRLTPGPLNPQLVGNMFPTTQHWVARRDIWNEETSFSPFHDKTETEFQRNFENLEAVYLRWYNYFTVKVKVIPQQAEVAQGVLGRLRPRINP